ncbi:phage major capsid protein [Schlesneria sp. T3-172]|uniref:phage major capsid protein n=1 Tax=Schlesneria sphaerica TaxID=3373610 RepID=UPI0037CC66F7
MAKTTQELQKEVTELTKMIAPLKADSAKLKALQGKPDYSGVRRDAEGRVTGYFEETDESVTIVTGRDDLNGPRAERRMKSRAAMKALIRQGYQPWGEFKSLGDFVRSGFDGHQSPDFRDRCRTHFKAIQGMSESVGSDGGFTVMPEFNSKIFEHVYANDLFAQTDNYTVNGNNMTFLANAETSRVNGSRHGGLRGYWTSEGQAITQSKPTVREVQMKLHKLAVVVYLTQELIDDGGQALEQFVTRKAGEEFNFMIGDSLFNGDAIGKPLGINNSPALLVISKESGPQTADTIVAQNIIKMQNRFFAPNFGNANWYINQDCMQQLMQLTLATGTYSGQLVFMPPAGLSGAPYGTLGGRPIKPIEFCPTLGDQGDIVLADLSQVLSISKGGINQATSTHVEFLTDQLALRFTMRMNAAPWENSPITPYKGTNTQSSFVALEAR